MKEFQPLTPKAVKKVMTLSRLYFRPEFLGLNNLDLEKPALFVGNHTRYGLLDVPLMIEHLYVNHGLFLRSLGDRSHFSVPVWRDWLTRNGMVMGTPENCDALMEAGESILVFPGGAREVWRRKDEQYTLIWKKRLGFVRQAIKHGYDIIPFAAYGADDCYKVVADANDVLGNPRIMSYLERKGMLPWLRDGDGIPPLGKGIGNTIIPRPERFYFSFGERIPTTELMGNAQDESTLWQVRDRASASIEEQLEDLKTIRNKDRNERWGRVRKRLCL